MSDQDNWQAYEPLPLKTDDVPSAVWAWLLGAAAIVNVVVWGLYLTGVRL